MTNQEDLWRLLQREIMAALVTYKSRAGCRIYVYTLLRTSIDIIVEQTGTLLHLSQTEPSSSRPELSIVITSNKRKNDLIVATSPDRGFILASGEALTAHEFCGWLFDFACELSSSGDAP